MFLGFGLPTAIGLISGPFGDQSFWQRVFSIKERYIGRAFLIGALVFGVVPAIPIPAARSISIAALVIFKLLPFTMSVVREDTAHKLPAYSPFQRHCGGSDKQKGGMALWKIYSEENNP